MLFVLDNSVACGWFVADQASDYTEAIAEQIARIPIQVDRRAVPRSELLGLALRFGLSSCDAVYVDLALRRMLPLATADDALREAALAAGVGWVAAPTGTPSRKAPARRAAAR